MNIEILKNRNLTNEDKETLKKLSLKIDEKEDFFLNEKDLSFIGTNKDNQITSVIKLSYVDNNLNNLYLSNFDDKEEEDDELIYNKFNVIAFSSFDEIEEFKFILHLGKCFSGSEFNTDDCITLKD